MYKRLFYGTKFIILVLSQNFSQTIASGPPSLTEEEEIF